MRLQNRVIQKPPPAIHKKNTLKKAQKKPFKA